MIDIERFKKENAAWDTQYGLPHSDKEWSENYDIACKVEQRLRNNYPMDGDVHPGDLVEFSDGYRVYKNALVCDIDRYGVCEVCEQWSAFTLGGSFSVSGGTFHRIHKSNFVRDGKGEAFYWTWGRNGSGANQGIYFPVVVQRWVVPYEKPKKETTVYFKTRTRQRDESRVFISGPHLSVIQSFRSVKAFKAWAEYVGFDYERFGQSYDGIICRRGRQNIVGRYFWHKEDIPDGARPYYDLCNGSMVRCYAANDGETITVLRPNPNAKEVFNPLAYEEAKTYEGNPMGA